MPKYRVQLTREIIVSVSENEVNDSIVRLATANQRGYERITRNHADVMDVSTSCALIKE